VSEGQTFLFADLAGFTALTEAHGDEQAADLAAEFCRSVEQILPMDGAEVIKTIGDAVMLRVSDAADAVRLGMRIAHEIGAQHGFPIVRVGMHTGPAVERDGDWFGAAVNVAARISGRASGGEVLLSAATRDRAGDFDDIRLDERGRVELKNVAAPVVLYAAYRESVRGPEGLALDPVCRMAVLPSESVGRLRWHDVEYEFCSLQCAAAFASAPEQYAEQ
jgi:class 3 adenylate cyclase/YHS domain-containing protein